MHFYNEQRLQLKLPN
ncbi:hypothetical protein [Brevibacillus formosus]